MGILDSEFAKIVLGGSHNYYRDKREDAIAGQVQGLLGQQGTIPGDMGPRPGDMMGTGLLGGQMTQPQFAQQLMGIPGLQQAATGLMNNQNTVSMSQRNQNSANQAAMDRTMFNNNNQSAESLARLGQQQNQWQNDFAQRQQKVDQEMAYKSKKYGEDRDKAYGDMGLDARKAILSENKGPRKIMQMANAVMERLPGFSNGMVDWDEAVKDPTIAHQAVVTLAKSILGEEAVSVDENNAIRAHGAPGWVERAIAWVNDGTVGPTQLKQIMQGVDSNARQAQGVARQNANDMKWHPGYAQGAPTPVTASRLPTGGTANVPPGLVMR